MTAREVTCTFPTHGRAQKRFGVAKDLAGEYESVDGKPRKTCWIQKIRKPSGSKRYRTKDTKTFWIQQLCTIRHDIV